MNLLSRIMASASSVFPPEQEIYDEQFLDKEGRYHLQAYLSFYERQDSLLSSSQETNMVDTLMTSLYTPPSYDMQHSWEEAHRLDAYGGGLKEYVVKPGIRRIGKQAFAYNLNLSRIEMPDSIEIIDKEAFVACENLVKIVIPKNVRFIGKDAFDHGMKSIILQGRVPPRISSLGINPSCKIIVPDACIDLYRKNRYWYKYRKQIIELNNT